MKDRSELRAKAEAATRGPWLKDGGMILGAPDADGAELTVAGIDWHGLEVWSETNAAYIAAAHPDRIIELLDALERAEAQADVRGGAWCAKNREEGRDACGACAWCCAQMRERAVKAEAELKRLEPVMGAVRALVAERWPERIRELIAAVESYRQEARRARRVKGVDGNGAK